MSVSASLVPIWPRFVGPVLQALAPGGTATRREIRRSAMDIMGLSEEARAELLDSGMTRAGHRADWAITHLSRSGLIDRVARAQYQITDAGQTWLGQHPEGLTDFTSANRMFGEFWTKGEHEPVVHTGESEQVAITVDPIEQIESGVARIKAEVTASLLDRIRASDPEFFEEAVVKVLLAMGYGGTEKRGKRIGGSGDGGVDGVIDQDALGLDQIYVQAKRYAAGHNVGRETIQAFVGALHGFQATRGVFITSSDFTSGARGYARGVPTRIVLIDGQRLAELMIEHRVGVQVKQSYDIVDVDEDFFE